ncbi:hypothetical protein HDE_09898 [Halotydeus destructor]|nr:hypothetical protein HDE_09898 [Halotydeus destructor]
MNKEATVSSSTTSSSLNAVNSHKTATKAPIANGQSGGHGWATKALNQSLVITLCLMLQLTTFIFRTNFPLDPRAGHCLTASTLLLGLVILACYSSCSTDHWHIGSEVTDDSKLVTSDSFALSALTVATAVHQASSSPSSAADLLNSTIHFGPDLIVPLDKIMTSEQIIPLADHSQFFASNHIYADHDIDTTVLQENHVTFHHGGHISHATIIN